jgi:hypothetical protein
MSEFGGMAAPRPQEMERMLGDAKSGHALWLETTPLQALTNPSKCQCTSGKDLLMPPLPTAAELATALANDDEKAALEQGLAQPLVDIEADYEALVGPKRQSLQSNGPLWCCGTAVSCALPPLCGAHPPGRSMLFSLADDLACTGRARTGLICCLLCIMPKCENSLYVDPIKEKLPGIVALHQAAFAAAGVELKYASDAKAHSDEAEGVKKTFRQKKYDFYYSGPALTFSR